MAGRENRGAGQAGCAWLSNPTSQLASSQALDYGTLVLRELAAEPQFEVNPKEGGLNVDQHEGLNV